MPYQISREGQLYGPYTLEDLQRYLASGNVLLTDLAKSEEMPDWVPVSQILAPPTPPSAGSGFAAQPAYAAPAYPAAVPYQEPPDLNWGLLLLIDVLTCGLMQVVWNLILAAWARRIEPASKALIYYIIALVFIVANFGSSFGNAMAAMRHEIVHPNFLGLSLGVIAWVIRLIARFSLRDTLEQHYNTAEPLGVRFNPVMTFFFGGIYFQYKLNEINRMKRGGLRYPPAY
ncbi:DUF4339 domain-containing protein [Edaphobacter bradus]|uniref:DUF4339 domain-containing protein n=1 Tax=Edaphobacter bradus TaxID=2259016 RepID=UPI0021DFEAFE|nr:DUF4339 domain-containing protein [Edaphobacter bradus]